MRMGIGKRLRTWTGDPMIEKRTQAERLGIAEELLTSVREEIEKGKADNSVIQTGVLLQIAVFCQVEINRIVWMLNRIENGYDY